MDGLSNRRINLVILHSGEEGKSSYEGRQCERRSREERGGETLGAGMKKPSGNS